MNYKSENYNYTNHSTHEDGLRSRWIHKLQAFINDQHFHEVVDLTSEEDVLKQTDKCKITMEREMHRLANAKQEKSFVEKMNELLD